MSLHRSFSAPPGLSSAPLLVLSIDLVQRTFFHSLFAPLLPAVTLKHLEMMESNGGAHVTLSFLLCSRGGAEKEPQSHAGAEGSSEASDVEC